MSGLSFMRLRRLLRNTKGSVYLELVATLIILSGIFIGCAVIGMKTIDFARDSRATSGAADLAWVLDKDTGSPDQSDFDIIGQKVLDMAGLEVGEEFQMYFTAVEFDHLGGGLRVAWQGNFGTDASRVSKVVINGGMVTVNGYDMTVLDDERIIVVEIYRSRRGLLVDNETPIYTYAVTYRNDPVHA
jgi:hypothetical protein